MSPSEKILQQILQHRRDAFSMTKQTSSLRKDALAAPTAFQHNKSGVFVSQTSFSCWDGIAFKGNALAEKDCTPNNVWLKN